MSGAAMVIERPAFAAVGGFDEKLFLYKEDEDLCLRLRESGWQVVYEPAIGDPAPRLGRGRPPPGAHVASSYFFAKHLRGAAFAPGVRGRPPVAALLTSVTPAYSPELVRRPVAEFQRTEHRCRDPAMGRRARGAAVDVRRQLAAGADQPHRVLGQQRRHGAPADPRFRARRIRRGLVDLERARACHRVPG